jgi:hypothetical protein
MVCYGILPHKNAEYKTSTEVELNVVLAAGIGGIGGWD